MEDDAAKNDRYCSPRRVIPFKSNHEGLHMEDHEAGIICRIILAASCDSVQVKSRESTMWRMMWQALYVRAW